MSRFLLLPLLLMLGYVPPRPATLATYCRVTILPDYTLGFAYYAILQRSPTCPADGIGRVRKVGTLNPKHPATKPGGLPQYGGVWGWTLSANGSGVPYREYWTSLSWRWQWYDGQRWRPVEVP